MSDDLPATNETLFKQCTCCPAVWRTRVDFLSDPGIELIGYQAHFEDLKTGLLLFNHTCHTTLAVDVESLRDLYTGPVFEQHACGSICCPGYCQHRSELRSCPVQCECAYVRAILQIVRHWEKRGA